MEVESGSDGVESNFSGLDGQTGSAPGRRAPSGGVSRCYPDGQTGSDGELLSFPCLPLCRPTVQVSSPARAVAAQSRGELRRVGPPPAGVVGEHRRAGPPSADVG
jgi:hypothetical protein